ncbi:MAG: hypothetical protein B7733_16150 [Myxococcales bacterium FL481]|nr:MAG: hypothetical protein B7733_16150 [Myxococcales bacterium FL481]
MTRNDVQLVELRVVPQRESNLARVDTTIDLTQGRGTQWRVPTLARPAHAIIDAAHARTARCLRAPRHDRHAPRSQRLAVHRLGEPYPKGGQHGLPLHLIQARCDHSWRTEIDRWRRQAGRAAGEPEPDERPSPAPAPCRSDRHNGLSAPPVLGCRSTIRAPREPSATHRPAQNSTPALERAGPSRCPARPARLACRQNARPHRHGIGSLAIIAMANIRRASGVWRLASSPEPRRDLTRRVAPGHRASQAGVNPSAYPAARSDPAAAMLFPTFDFLLFIIPTLIGFWALAGRPRARGLFLLGASYLFYMAGPKTEPPPAPPYYLGLLLFSTALDFVAGAQIHRFAPLVRDDDPELRAFAIRHRNTWLTASLVGNLGLLAYFKYLNFLIEAFTDLLAVFGGSAQPLHLDIVLPLGISFYTFQSLSYTIDVWRQKLEPEPSFARFALFVVFFPQLVAGPIVRASQFLPQLRAGPRFSREGIETGAFRVCQGLVKKVVLGDWIAVQLTDRVFDTPETFTSLELMVALYAYTLQLYADFSGYSDIAIGTARMLGFTLPENFDRPYQSRDIAEYWRRWHMTLSTWLRDYVFFSLLARFGSRGGYLAVWLTMFLVGMWHGASWNFVFFANIHAGAMVFNRWNRTRDRKSPVAQTLPRRLAVAAGLFAGFTAIGHWSLHLTWLDAGLASGLIAAAGTAVTLLPLQTTRRLTPLHILATFHLLVFSRIFFRAPDLDTSRQFIRGLLAFDGHGIRPGLTTGWVWLTLVVGVAYHFTPKAWVDVHALRIFRKLPAPILGVLFAALAFGLMKLLEGAPRAFIYFQF